MSSQFLVEVYIREYNITLLNTPVNYFKRTGFKFQDLHWIAVILLNDNKNKTIDYLEYIKAKDGYAFLYDLPYNDKITFIA